MSNSKFINDLYNKCKFHGTGDAQVLLRDDELYALICISIINLEWSFDDLKIQPIELPDSDYYMIPLNWFDNLKLNKDPQEVIASIEKCFNNNNDFSLFITNLSQLHRRRIKYRRILAAQPLPTMDQIGPRVLLEYGVCDLELLANWMVWRKWIYDIDNRSAQETGYLFEPLLASCLGGETVGARNSPVKRIDLKGRPTSNGRQIDCYIPSKKTAYELKLRVTIAASGQGRFPEEMSFPLESRAAGIKPILLVLDPTTSPRLSDLSKQYEKYNGEFYHGDAAWMHMEQEAGEVVSVFIENYIKPAIKAVETIDISALEAIKIEWDRKYIEIAITEKKYRIRRH